MRVYLTTGFGETLFSVSKHHCCRFKSLQMSEFVSVFRGRQVADMPIVCSGRKICSGCNLSFIKKIVHPGTRTVSAGHCPQHQLSLIDFSLIGS